MQERLFNTHMWEHLIFDTLWYTAINKLIVQDRLYIEEPRPMRSDTIILKTAKSIIVIIRRTQRHSSQVDPHTNGWALILVLLKILDLHIHSTFSLWILFQTWSFATTNQDQDIDKSYNSTNTIKNITFSWVSDLRPYSRARDQSLLSRPMPKTRWCGSFRSHSPPLLLGFEGRTAQKEANLIVQIKISHIFSNTNENSLTSIECNLQSKAASLVWDAEASGIPMHPNSTKASALEYPRISHHLIANRCQQKFAWQRHKEHFTVWCVSVNMREPSLLICHQCDFTASFYASCSTSSRNTSPSTRLHGSLASFDAGQVTPLETIPGLQSLSQQPTATKKKATSDLTCCSSNTLQRLRLQKFKTIWTCKPRRASPNYSVYIDFCMLLGSRVGKHPTPTTTTTTPATTTTTTTTTCYCCYCCCCY